MARNETTQKISPKDLSRIFVECYQDADGVNDFMDRVIEKSGYVMTRYFLASVYYALDMLAVG